MGMNILGVAGLGVCALALILGCVGCGIPYWGEGSITVSGFKVEYNTGLWYRCLKPETNAIAEDCGSLDLDDDFENHEARAIKATRAMVLLGIFTCVGAVVVGGLVLFVMKDKKILFFAAAGLAIAAGLFHMIGLAVYADKFEEEGDIKYHAGFALNAVAWILAWIGGGLFAGAKLTDKD